MKKLISLASFAAAAVCLLWLVLAESFAAGFVGLAVAALGSLTYESTEEDKA